jgi:hypothetical protein
MSVDSGAKIRASVACSRCGAQIGEYCIGSVHISAHAERRAGWQAARGPVPEIKPAVVCDCGQNMTAHGSERNDEYGCEKYDCALAREAARMIKAT